MESRKVSENRIAPDLHRLANIQDVDAIFRMVPVPQIKAMERRAALEVESKKSQLRNVVGERYRDLLEAAETIIALKTQSREIMLSLQEMKASAAVTLSPGKREESLALSKSSSAHPQFSTLACCRLLETTAELMWEHVENGQLLDASKSLVLQRQTMTALSQMQDPSLSNHIRRGIEDQLARSRENYELARHELSSQALAKLRSPTGTTAVAKECLVTFILLESISVKECLDRLLQARLLQIQAASQGSANDDSQLPGMCHAIIGTLSGIDELFIGQGGTTGEAPGLQKCLQELEKSPLLNLLSLDDLTPGHKTWLPHLPIGLRRFTVYLDTNGGLGSVDPSLVRATVSSWFELSMREYLQKARQFAEGTNSWDMIMTMIQTINDCIGAAASLNELLVADKDTSGKVLWLQPLFEKALHLFREESLYRQAWLQILEGLIKMQDTDVIIGSWFSDVSYQPFLASVEGETLLELARARRWGRFQSPWLAQVDATISAPLHTMAERAARLLASLDGQAVPGMRDHSLEDTISRSVSELVDALQTLWDERPSIEQVQRAIRLCQLTHLLSGHDTLRGLLASSESLSGQVCVKMDKIAQQSIKVLAALLEKPVDAAGLFEAGFQFLSAIPGPKLVSTRSGKEGTSALDLSSGNALLFAPHHMAAGNLQILMSQLVAPPRTSTNAVPMMSTAAMNADIVEPASKYFRLLS